MPRAQQIGPDIFAAAEQIPSRLFLLGGHMHGGQGASTVQNRELHGIPPVRFDADARATRNERWRDHVTRHVSGLKKSLQLEAARSGFVAATHAAAADKPTDESPDRREIWCQLVRHGRPLAGRQDRRHD
jgi:hypothetical protein